MPLRIGYFSRSLFSLASSHSKKRSCCYCCGALFTSPRALAALILVNSIAGAYLAIVAKNYLYGGMYVFSAVVSFIAVLPFGDEGEAMIQEVNSADDRVYTTLRMSERELAQENKAISVIQEKHRKSEAARKELEKDLEATKKIVGKLETDNAQLTRNNEALETAKAHLDGELAKQKALVEQEREQTGQLTKAIHDLGEIAQHAQASANVIHADDVSLSAKLDAIAKFLKERDGERNEHVQHLEQTIQTLEKSLRDRKKEDAAAIQHQQQEEADRKKEVQRLEDLERQHTQKLDELTKSIKAKEDHQSELLKKIDASQKLLVAKLAEFNELEERVNAKIGIHSAPSTGRRRSITGQHGPIHNV